MSNVFTILRYNERQSLSRTYVTALLVILAVALCFVQIGVYEYKKSQEQKTIFQDVENNVINSYATYRHYATYGFRILFSPSPISVLFTNSAILHDLTGNIETGFRMNIYQTMKGRGPFGINQYLFADFSGIFLYFGGLLILFYGHKTFLATEYLRHLASITGKKNLYLKLFLEKAITAALFTLLFLAPAVLLITLNGITICIDKYLTLLFLKMYFTSLTFLFFGFVFGASKSIIKGLVGAVTTWILLVMFIPFLINFIVSITSGSIKPESQLEIEKLKLMMEFEKSSNEKAGILDIDKQPADIDKELVESYYKNQFQKMQALENELKAQMQAHTDFYYKLSTIFPTTSYLALTQEISTKGHENLYAFYQTIIQTKEAFFKEYMKQVYFSNQSNQPAKVEPFLKGDENIFVGKPALPGYLLEGFIISLFWLAGLGVIAYYRFKKSLFELPEKKKKDPALLEVKLDTYNINSFLVSNNLLTRQFYNFLSNEPGEFKKHGYSLKLIVNDNEFDIAKQKQGFLYLCHPSDLPGNLKTRDYLNLMIGLMKIDKTKQKEIISRPDLAPIWTTKLCRLEGDEMGHVYQAVLDMKQFPIYLFGDTGRKMVWEFCYPLVEKMLSLSNDDTIVIHLYENMEEILFQSSKSFGFQKNNIWLNHVLKVKESLNE